MSEILPYLEALQAQTKLCQKLLAEYFSHVNEIASICSELYKTNEIDKTIKEDEKE